MYILIYIHTYAQIGLISLISKASLGRIIHVLLQYVYESRFGVFAEY
jgi:hypothetical protein